MITEYPENHKYNPNLIGLLCSKVTFYQLILVFHNYHKVANVLNKGFFQTYLQ